MDTDELKWAAGFFDGEGHTRANWQHDAFWQLRVHVTQADRRVLDRFHRAVGGIGKIYGPYAPRSPKHRARYDYVAEGMPAQAIIAYIWTWLDVVKREQARDAMLKIKLTAAHIRNGLQPACRRGHPFNEKNTQSYIQGAKRYQSRKCRMCARDKMRRIRLVRTTARAMLSA